MHISQTGVDFIKLKEGFEAVAYLDISGFPTIGYGQHIGVTRADVEARKTITEEQGEVLLRRWLSKQVEPYLSGKTSLVRVPLEQYEYDALASFIYNFGPDNFRKSTLRAKLNKGDKAGAAEEFLRWNKSYNPKAKKRLPVRGLTIRRAQERAMFLNEPLPPSSSF